jgi:hypothetical protein
MATARRLFVTGVSMVLVGLLMIAPSFASDPASQDATVPASSGQVVLEWTGEFLPFANATSSCSGPAEATADAHTIDLTVPAGLYDDKDLLSRATFTIFAPDADSILTIEGPTDQTTQDSDSGSSGASETIQFSKPPAGTYKILACAFAATAPTEYRGTLTLETGPAVAGKLPSCEAPGQPLEFTQEYIDTTRAGGEPIVATHPNGRLLWGSHAGTTHFFGPAAPDEDTAAFLRNYEGQTYQYFSGNGGKDWEFVERLPNQENQEAGLPNSGFSDPEFAIDKAGQVYISEINLANVAFSKSTDGGRSYTLQSVLGLTLSDRQWMEADQRDVLYLTANTFGGGSGSGDPVTGDLQHKFFKSTDGGKTFTAGEVANPGGVGDIRVDKSNGNVYELSLEGGVLKMARFEDMRGTTSDFADHVKFSTIAEGVDTLSILAPTFDIDDDGNLYATWDESGAGARKAGIWFSASRDAGQTWLPPVRVDKGNTTDIWPWVAVGDAGRVAVTWLQNTTSIPGHDAEEAPDDSTWNVMVAQTMTGLGCGRAKIASTSTAAPDGLPGFTVTKASSPGVHQGTICQGGTTCQAMAIDRRLGDYFANEIDSEGRTYIAVSDTRKGGSVALPLVIRQTGGPRFISAANRRPPPGHRGKGVGEGPDGVSLFVEDDSTLPATGGGVLVVLGLLLMGAGLVVRRRAQTAS